MNRVSVSLWLCIALLPAAGCGNSQPDEPSQVPEKEVKARLGIPPYALGPLHTATLRIGNVTAEVELAFGESEQTQGLMYRTAMEENHGMLFVYREPEFLSFWMMNTRLPLSIAFIKPDGTIDVIRDMKALDTSVRYRSRHRCQFALEMNQGWFDRNGIKPGDRVELPEEVKNYLKTGSD
jgi:hypothetical protein